VEAVENRLVKGAWYPSHQIPDSPNSPNQSKWSTKMRDFDNGPGNFRDGAYINKADDGNMSVMDLWFGGSNKVQTVRNAYFVDSQLQIPTKGAFFTPNRMIVSPGMFGSLSTGVYGSRGTSENDNGVHGVPWRTLLFRPGLTEGHVGAPAYISGGVSPADHYFMDLFWMPIIEPRPLSQGFSTEGKVNLNWQMLPFTHIRRETALRAAMKDIIITAVNPNDAADNNKRVGTPNPAGTYRSQYKSMKGRGGAFPLNYWSETDQFHWQRRLNIPETTRQMEERFMCNTVHHPATHGLFRTASQLCEIHLIPQKGNSNDGLNFNGTPYQTAGRNARMAQFWQANSVTGDNSRERPYSVLYQKVTTKSNTYRVHFLAQSILKARSVAPNTVDTTRDTVSATYRGSALLERYLDTNVRTDYPNYANGQGTAPTNASAMERFHRYRIIEMKQFVP
jgi:uncharacterized protein (TIGR02600 family)